jgi:hypothetical protein
MSNGNRKLIKFDILTLDPRMLEAIQSGSNVTGIYSEFPLEDLLFLDEMTKELPGLRFVLRKQRDKYLLTVLQTKHLDQTREDVRGEP